MPARIALVGLLAVVACTAERREGFQPPPTPPGIGFSPTSLAFLASQGGTDPAPQNLTITNLGGGTLDSLIVSSITYAAGQPTGWLAAAASGSPPLVTVQPSIGVLAAGQYSASLVLSHPTASNSPRTVPVTLTISAQPVLGLSTRLVRYSATPGQAGLAPQLVSLTNLGPGNLTGMTLGQTQYASGEPIGWLTPALAAGGTPTTLSLTASAASLTAGTYSASVMINAPGAAVNPEVVAVQITVSPAPVITLATTTVNFNATAGGTSPAAASVGITNGGGGTLTGLSMGTIQYGAGAAGWLTVTLNGTSAPTSITVTPSITSLPPGTYLASIPIQSSDTTIPGVGLNVRLTLTAPPTIGFSSGTINFTAIAGGNPPATQSVLVSNTGSGTLSGLSVGTITYGPGGGGWLGASLLGTAAPATITLTATPGALAQGIYSATVPVSSTSPGATTKNISVTLAIAANAPAAIVGLNGNNQTGLVSSPLPLTIRARVLNSVSNPFVGAPVTWNAGQGGSVSNTTTTTDQNGEVIATWTLGPNAGPQTLTVQTPGVPSFNFAAVATNLPVSGRPNEPPGLTQLTDRPFNAKVELGWTDRGDPAFHIVPDGTAPQSLPTVGEATFPLGYTGGRGPILTEFATSSKPRHVYLAFWFKLSPNWDGHSSYVNKIYHIWIGAYNRVYLTLTGIDTLPFTARVALQNVNENPISRNLNPNSGNQKKIFRNTWHLWELELIANTQGQPNGEARWWIDGVKQGDYTGINYVQGGTNNWWEFFDWNPTWGGQGDVVPSTQFMWMDHAYVSGQ